MTGNIRILLVGSTGMLGNSILEALEIKSIQVRVLLRSGKSDVEEAFKKKGIEVANGDVLDPATLTEAVKDVQVVISALHNDPSVFVPGHKNLIAASEKAGVKRFIPSGFSVDYFKIDSDENFNLAMRRELIPLFDGLKLRPIHVLIGAFIDTMMDPNAPFIDWKSNSLPYFGNGNQKCDFSSVRDTGRYVA